ncbi:hypothetical protein [Methylococcus sp. EFPC2]|uniref:hypothetical protein n=1 Tax=Methylococcus sp. EFPC2 TaxID=2812648 RepID=UPI0019689F58|nr:hypothetical protein [Methylococcus sp. EFPC2]QSA95650.1 hypothetical protein JWZ97_10335 [Methylococcus sp. EFPC2]
MPSIRKTHAASWLTLLLLAVNSAVHAAGVSNGDFQTGDFSGWTLDTDATPGASPDFQIIDSAGNYSARIEADGAGDTVFFANTLFQSLDLSLPAEHDLILRFDWTYAGDAEAPDETFLVGFGDGTGNYYDANAELGLLFNPQNYGAGTFSAKLNALANLSGWTLEFQLLAGFDGLSSHVTLDNISLSAVAQPTPVPIPPAMLLFASGLLGVFGYKKHKTMG